MKNPKYRYEINQCALYKCQSKKKICSLLDISDSEFNTLRDSVKYHCFEIYKKDNSDKRKITAPNQRLKIVQKRLLQLIQYVKRPDWLISGERGKCYIDNGKAHIMSHYVLTMDIKNFYDNCNREYVFRFFKDKMLMAGDIAGFCTDLVCLEGGIPTGCPTSQLIAFYAYEAMFFELYEVACENKCIFTVYVDDLTFSAENPFNVNLLKREADIRLRKYGHRPKYKKVKYYGKDIPAPITGTILMPDNKLKVPNNLQKKIYDNFQDIKNLCDVEAIDKVDLKKINTLQGQIQAARSIEPEKYKEIGRISSAKVQR
jgi:RNA-directed DNA polymerase